jgi:hypothetical protein
MQTISSAELSLLESYSPVHLHLYVGGAEIPAKLSTFNLTSAVGDEALNCGNSVASVMQVGAVAEEIYRGLVTRDGKEIVTRLGEQIMAKFLWNGLVGSTVGITWDVDGSTEHSLFQGKIEKCVVNSGRAQITAQDELFWNGSRLFAGQSSYQATVSAQTVLETIASEMGVTLNAATSSLASGVSIYNGFSSCRDQLQLYQAAGYVAGILGGNAVINRDGELAVVRYATASFSTEVYQGGSSAENENYAPSGVRFVRQITTRITNADGTISESDTIATYSAGDGSVEMENPLANKAAATRAFNALRTISSRKGTYSFPMGIQMEPGDVITVTTMDGTYPVAIVSQQLDIDGGVKSTVRGAGQMYPNGVNGTMTNTYTPTRNLMRSARLLGETADEEDEPDTNADEIIVPGHVGPVTQRLNSLELEMLKVKNLQAENAEITNANIQSLKAGNIDVDALLAQDATVTGQFEVDNGSWQLLVDDTGFYLRRVTSQNSYAYLTSKELTFTTEQKGVAGTVPPYVDVGYFNTMILCAGATTLATGLNSELYVQGDTIFLQGSPNGTAARDCIVDVQGSMNPDITAAFSLGAASLRWNYIYLSNNPNVSSDRNVKREIREDLPDIVDRLRPVRYKRRGDPDTVYYGFIAQDVEDALKQVGIDTDNIGLVTFETDAEGNKTNYALSYEEFIPLLTAKIQSQQKQIDSLTERLELLERMINDGR